MTAQNGQIRAVLGGPSDRSARGDFEGSPDIDVAVVPARPAGPDTRASAVEHPSRAGRVERAHARISFEDAELSAHERRIPASRSDPAHL
jgi:hypothetical protein